MNILVTGGTSAVGRELVALLAAEGHRVVFTWCRSGELAGQLCRRWRAVESRHVDFTDRGSVEAFVAEVPALHVDALVNNAYVGSALGTHFHRTPPDEFRRAFDDNVVPTVLITRACIASMRPRRSGLIVTVGSLATIGLPPKGYSVYAATKSYLQQLALAWQSEYSPLGIRSTVVLPDFMPTALHGDMAGLLAEQRRSRGQATLTPAQTAAAIAAVIQGKEYRAQWVIDAPTELSQTLSTDDTD